MSKQSIVIRTENGIRVRPEARAQFERLLTKARLKGLQEFRTEPTIRSFGAALILGGAEAAGKFARAASVKVGRAVAAVLPAILAPVGEQRELLNFPYPNLDEADLPIGGYTVQDCTALVWESVQDDLNIHFLFRRAGETGPNSWRKPPIIAENSRLGMRSLVLVAGVYQFAPYPDTRAFV